MTIEGVAQKYARRGWRVFPIHTPSNGACDCRKAKCESPGKHPRTANGFKDATTDTKVIAGWLRQWPTTNLGIATGAVSGIVVLDVDTDKHGDDTLADLEAEHGKLPDTVECVTGGGGRHVYFQHPGGIVPNSQGAIGPGLDIRGDGGYVVAPPSLHASGRTYDWEASSLPSRTPLAPLPAWLRDLIVEKPKSSLNGHIKPAPALGEAIPEGQRNATLHSLAGTMRRRNMSEAAIYAALSVTNQDCCRPPVADDELQTIIHSAMRYEPAEMGGVAIPEGATEPVLKRDGDAVFWLWPSVGIGVGFDLIRETSWGIRGEISIQTIDPLKTDERTGHIYSSQMDISSGEQRSKLATTLLKRPGLAAIDWTTLLEAACYRTIEAWRMGEPVIDLSVGDVEEDQRYLIEKFLPDSETTVMFADGGSGKSTLALAFGMAIRMGINLPHGLRPTKQANVLYLDWETNAATAKRRQRWLARGFGVKDPPPVLYRPMYRALADDIARIRQEVMRSNVGLVILDSIGPACGGEPENAETMLRLFNALRSLNPAARLVISHVSRAGAESKNGTARPFGSVFVQNMARSVWEVRKSGESDTLSLGLYHRKTNEGRLHEPMGLQLVYDEAAKAVRIESQELTDDPELAAHTSLSYRIRAALRSGSQPIKQLAEDLDAPEDTVRKTLRRMRDVRQVEVGERGRGHVGRWGLATPGDDDERF